MKRMLYIATFVVIVATVIVSINSFNGGDSSALALTISGTDITISDLTENVRANKQFYQSNKKIDFNATDGDKMEKLVKKQVLQAMTQDALVQKLVSDAGINISEEEIQQELDRVIDSVGDRKNLENNLSDVFGWTIEDFKNNVVKTQIAEQSLRELLSNDTALSGDTYSQMETILKRVKDGEDFGELAKELSECPSGARGGDLGKFAKASDDFQNQYPHMVAPFEEATFALELEEISDIVKTQFGYHIIKLTSKTVDDSGVPIAEASHILLKTVEYDDWFLQKKQEANVTVHLDAFVWNKETGELEFVSESMRKFEQEKQTLLES